MASDQWAHNLTPIAAVTHLRTMAIASSASGYGVSLRDRHCAYSDCARALAIASSRAAAETAAVYAPVESGDVGGGTGVDLGIGGTHIALTLVLGEAALVAPVPAGTTHPPRSSVATVRLDSVAVERKRSLRSFELMRPPPVTIRGPAIGRCQSDEAPSTRGQVATCCRPAVDARLKPAVAELVPRLAAGQRTSSATITLERAWPCERPSVRPSLA